MDKVHLLSKLYIVLPIHSINLKEKGKNEE